MPYAPITITSGKFVKTTAFFEKLSRFKVLEILNRYGQMGVEALRSVTPTDSGVTAASWYYTTGQQNSQYYLDFHNSHVEDGVPIAIILQYGHGTRTGGYVAGRDYINPVIKPIFDRILEDVRREVKAL